MLLLDCILHGAIFVVDIGPKTLDQAASEDI